MKELYFLILICLGSLASTAQSQAGAYASATIISPVGVELSSDMYREYSSVDFKSKPSKAPSGKLKVNNTLSTIEHTIASVSSIKIIGSENVFDVSVQQDTIVLRNVRNETMKATVYPDKFYSSQRLDTSDPAIMIAAKITCSPTQAKGSYKSTTPYIITINYN